MKKIFLFLLVANFILTVSATPEAAFAEDSSYSIQITALPLEQKNDGFTIYEKLKKKGYLVYYYKVNIKDRWWMRLKVGVFPGIAEAQAFGKKFSREEGFDFFVTGAAVIVTPFKDQYEIVTTPNAIWKRQDSAHTEIFRFSQSQVESTEVLARTKPVVSPDGKTLAFSYDAKAETLDLSGATIIGKRESAKEAASRPGSGRDARGDLDPDISNLSLAIKTDPGNVEAYYHRGNVYRRQGQYDKAIADYNQAIALNPGRAEFFTNRGIAFGEKKLYDKAVSDYGRAIEMDAKAAYAYNNRGAVYLNNGRYDEAIRDFDKAIEINPGFALAYLNRGKTHGNSGRHTQAISDFSRAIAIDPGDASAHSSRGIAYFYLKLYDKAWDDVHKAQALGYRINSDFLKALREASGRQK